MFGYKEEILENKRLVNEQFNELQDKNKFECLYKFCDKYEFSSSKINFCMELAKNYIINNITNFSKEESEVRYLVRLMGFLFENEGITVDEFIKIMNKYIKEEEQKDEHYVESCKVSN